MCIHKRVIEESDREVVDSACRSMTAPWVRQRHKNGGGAEIGDDLESGGSGELCNFFENYDRYAFPYLS